MTELAWDPCLSLDEIDPGFKIMRSFGPGAPGGRQAEHWTPQRVRSSRSWSTKASDTRAQRRFKR